MWQALKAGAINHFDDPLLGHFDLVVVRLSRNATSDCDKCTAFTHADDLPPPAAA